MCCCRAFKINWCIILWKYFLNIEHWSKIYLSSNGWRTSPQAIYLIPRVLMLIIIKKKRKREKTNWVNMVFLSLKSFLFHLCIFNTLWQFDATKCIRAPWHIKWHLLVRFFSLLDSINEFITMAMITKHKVTGTSQKSSRPLLLLRLTILPWEI